MTNYFLNGAVVTVVEELAQKDQVLVKVEKDYVNASNVFNFEGQEVHTNRALLEELVEDTVPIGSKITYKKGSFKGTVVGYEYTTNKAVCVSDKIGQYKEDRTRYVYSAKDLNIVNRETVVNIKAGNIYTINGVKFHAILNEANCAKVDLVSYNCNVTYKGIPRNIRKEELYKDFGLTADTFK